MSTPLGPPTGTYAPPTDGPAEPPPVLLSAVQMLALEALGMPALPTPTPEAMPWAGLLARDEALREAIDGATTAGDLERARALFLERLGVGREIGRRKALESNPGMPVAPVLLRAEPTIGT